LPRSACRRSTRPRTEPVAPVPPQVVGEPVTGPSACPAPRREASRTDTASRNSSPSRLDDAGAGCPLPGGLEQPDKWFGRPA
jgi:hypothetical protein